MVFEKYIFRQLWTRISVIILITIMILLLENMLTLFQFMLKANGPVMVVFQMLFFLIPEYLALGLSIGLMLGTMLVFKRLAQEQELASALACQVSPMRLMRMPILFGLLFAMFNATIVSYVRPYAEYKYSKLSFDARHGAFGVSLEAGKFTKLGPETLLYAESVGEGGNALTSIFLEMTDKEGRFTFATAESGSFYGSSDPNILIFKMKNGRMVTTTQATGPKPQTLTFDTFDLPIDLPKIPGFRDPSTLKELTLPQLFDRSEDAAYSKVEQNQMSGEAHKRIALAILPLILPFMAVALAVPPPRRNSSTGLVVGLGLLISMFKLLDFSVMQQITEPKYIIWPLVLVFIVLSVRFFYVFAVKVGKMPLSGLATFVDWLVCHLGRLIKKMVGFKQSDLA